MIKIRRKIPEAWYCGSLIQQNHGEANDKGLLIWEIQDKENFTVRPFHFKNPKPFVSVHLNEDGTLPEIDVPANSRLRLVLDHPLTLKQLQEAKEEAIWRWKPISVAHKDNSERVALSDEDSIHYSQENLRDIEVQEELIYQHLKGRQLDDGVLERVLQINREVDKMIEYSDETYRHIRWSIDKFNWDNLFKYGEGNEIDFKNLSGLIGIFGKSYTGKSSIVDSLLFTIFNSIAKEAYKNVDFINDNKETANSKISIKAQNKVYTIERSLKKTKRKGKIEAGGDVNFKLDSESLNGLSRIETDANIRKIFGTIEDFKLTSMIPQFDALSFINTKSTGRKEILAKYLDLEIFEEKFKLVKDTADALKGAVKLSKDIDYDLKIGTALESLKLKKEELKTHIDLVDKHNEQVDKFKEDLYALKGQIRPEINNLLEESQYELLKIKLESKIKNLEDEINTFKAKKSELEFNLLNLQKNLEKYKGIDLIKSFFNLSGTLRDKFQNKFIELEVELQHLQEDKELLCKIPCDDQFPDCMFIKSAYESRNRVPGVEKQLKLAKFNHELYKELRTKLMTMVSEYSNCEHELNSIDYLLQKANSDLNKTELKLITANKELETNDKLLLDSKQNKEQFELKKQFANKEKELNQFQRSFDKDKQHKLQKEVTLLEGEIEYLRKEKQQHLDRMKEYQAYELYLKCMHSNGIAYDIIKQKLPIINQEIEKILDGIFDFTIRFEAEDKKLEIFICHPNQSPRIVTIGSGAEQTIASIAITLALRMVTTLPQSDLFILDEPIGALDDDLKMEFIKFLEYIRNQFKTVFLITHLDSLKDVVDKELTIEHIDGFARIKA